MYLQQEHIAHLYCVWNFLFSYNVRNSIALIIINSLTSRTTQAKILSTEQHAAPTTFLAFLTATYYLSIGFIFSMSTSFRLTSKRTAVICPSSDVAPIMIVAIMKSHTMRVTVSMDPTAGPLWHGKSAIMRPPSEEPSRLGRPNASPLPPPLWRLTGAVARTHARTCELAELHVRTASPRSLRLSARAFTPIATCPALVWDGDDRDPPQRGSRQRKRMQALPRPDPAPRPATPSHEPRARRCALTAAAGARRRHEPMSRDAR